MSIEGLSRVILLFLAHSLVNQVLMCPVEYCASVITKCQVRGNCSCQGRLNMTCRIDCANCLDSMFFHCCSCLDLCSNVDEESLESEVQLLEPVNSDLFDLVLQDKELETQWTATQIDTNDLNNRTYTCSMLFMNECMGMNRCRDGCLSLGAGSFRWFHTGCCECVGPRCNNFGLNEMKCSECTGFPSVDHLTLLQ